MLGLGEDRSLSATGCWRIHSSNPSLDPTKGEDCMVWNFDKQRRFSVNSAFEFLVHEEVYHQKAIWMRNWELPVPQRRNKVKVNVDGSSNTRNGEAGAGCVVRNTDVEWLARSTKVLGRYSPIMAELCAMLGELQLCARLGFERIVVETDFREV
ncbi:hypothetical protein Scep_030228 [Stephania cephalantha]|uniref:RNase H type-1 domain-containing protein n=1 Tax=Stephania cephalantha TaxID=152367 RepID=A0AAP0HGB1_9MAGN